MSEVAVNCAEACVNGCILGDKCPHRAYVAEASKFVAETSMDQILDIAQKSVAKRFAERMSREVDEYFQG